MRLIAISGFLLCLHSNFILAQTPAITDGQILNGASFAPGQPVSPGSIIAIFGSQLADTLSQGDSLPLSSTIGTTSVTINGANAPLYFVSPTQVNAIVPWAALPANQDSATVPVVVRRGSNSSPSRSVQLTKTAPAVFTLSFGTRVFALAYDSEDGALAQTQVAVPGLTSHPTSPGRILSILCTGLGLVDPPVADGDKPGADTPRVTVQTPTVLIGGQQAELLFSGLTADFPGVYQINARVPDAAPAGAAVPVQIQLGGVTTSDQVTIAVLK